MGSKGGASVCGGGGAESLDCELREANVSLYWQEELPTTLLAQSSITGRVGFVSNLNS